MAGNAAELGKKFLEELAGKLPDSLRGNLTTILSSSEAQAALETVGSRVSPLDEERRALEQSRTQLASTQQKLDDWKRNLGSWKSDTEAELAERERKIAEREAAGGGGGGNRTGDPPPNNITTPPNTDFVSRKELAEREAIYVQHVSDVQNFGAFHLKNFGEPLDANAIVQHEKIRDLGFRGVYELVHREKLEKMRTDAETAKENLIRADERQKVLAERPVDMPYPIADGGGSPLDALSLAADKRPTGDPAAATRMYEQLVAGNAGR